jgi:fermentation-respiration switch protein FrsA (DUF1100 family)
MLFLVLSVLVAACAVWWGLAFFLQRGVLFPRGYAVQEPGARLRLPGLEERWIDTPQGRVEAWFVVPPGASRERPVPVAVFAHGNAELIDAQVALAGAYVRLGMAVLLPEYRGYGRSAGSPSQEAIVADAQRFLEDLLLRPEVDGARVVYHGRSVGAGVACALASRRPPAALILESPFRSVTSMSARYGVPSFLVRDPFDNESVVRALDRPILLFHGNCDTIVPYEHGVALQAAARRATLVTYDCDHNELPPDSGAHWAHIESFLRANDVLR